MTNNSNAFDNDIATAATYSAAGSVNVCKTLGKTFSTGVIKYIRICASASSFQGTGWPYPAEDCSINLSTYDGSTWSNVALLASDSKTGSVASCSYNSIYSLNAIVQGLAITICTSLSNEVAGYGGISQSINMLISGKGDATIKHSIPSGIFSQTVSSIIGVPLFAEWEDGSDLQYMISNATENSGWLEYNKVSKFTPFTAEPTLLTLKLIPKSINPSPGYPSIYGFYINELK